MNNKLHKCINCKACHHDIHEPAWWESDRRTYDYYYCYDPEWSDEAVRIYDPYEEIDCDCFVSNEEEEDNEYS